MVHFVLDLGDLRGDGVKGDCPLVKEGKLMENMANYYARVGRLQKLVTLNAPECIIQSAACQVLRSALGTNSNWRLFWWVTRHMIQDAKIDFRVRAVIFWHMKIRGKNWDQMEKILSGGFTVNEETPGNDQRV